MTHHNGNNSSEAAWRTINFEGVSIQVFDDPDGPLVACKSVAQALDLTWQAQRQRLNRQPGLMEYLETRLLPTNGGAQSMVCLPLSLLPLWLFSIDACRLRDPSKQERITSLQRGFVHAVATFSEHQSIGFAGTCGFSATARAGAVA